MSRPEAATVSILSEETGNFTVFPRPRLSLLSSEEEGEPDPLSPWLSSRLAAGKKAEGLTRTLAENSIERSEVNQ